MPSLETICHFAGWMVAVVSLLMLIRFAWGDRAKGRRRCPKCWYDMSSHAKAGKLVCPECGKDAKRERGLRRTRRRKRWALLAIVMLIASSFIYRIADARQHGWAAIVPTAALAVMLPVLREAWVHYGYSPEHETLSRITRSLSRELQRRFRSFDDWLTIEQHVLMSVVATSRPKPWDRERSDFFWEIHFRLEQSWLEDPKTHHGYLEKMLRDSVWTREMWVEGEGINVWVRPDHLPWIYARAELAILDANGDVLAMHSHFKTTGYLLDDMLWSQPFYYFSLPLSMTDTGEVILRLRPYRKPSEEDADLAVAQGFGNSTYAIEGHAMAEVEHTLRFDLVNELDHVLTEIDPLRMTPIAMEWMDRVIIKDGRIDNLRTTARGQSKAYVQKMLEQLDEGQGFGWRFELVQDGSVVAYSEAWHRHSGFIWVNGKDAEPNVIDAVGSVLDYMLTSVTYDDEEQFLDWLSDIPESSTYELRVTGDPSIALRDPLATTYWDDSFTVALRVATDRHGDKVLVGPKHPLYPKTALANPNADTETTN